MFQDARLLPWKTVIDNVGLGLRGQWRDAALQALDAVGLADRARDWPAALSGGQKQRVATARALIHRPRLLLLDEPLGALDALTRIEMQGLIETLWQQHGFTVLLVTHDVSEAIALADRVILIEEGRIGLDLSSICHGRAAKARPGWRNWKPKCWNGYYRRRLPGPARARRRIERIKKGRQKPSLDLFSVKKSGVERLTDLLVQIAGQIFQPFQLFQRLAHQRLAARVVTLQANQRFNQARGDLRVTLVEIAEDLRQN